MICTELNKAVEKEIRINKQLRKLQDMQEIMTTDDVRVLREHLLAIEKHFSEKKRNLTSK